MIYDEKGISEFTWTEDATFAEFKSWFHAEVDKAVASASARSLAFQQQTNQITKYDRAIQAARYMAFEKQEDTRLAAIRRSITRR